MYNETLIINDKKVKAVTENNLKKIDMCIVKICLKIHSIHNAHNVTNSKVQQFHDNLIEELKKLLNKYIKNLTSYELYDLEIFTHIEYSLNQMLCRSFGTDPMDIGNVKEIFEILMKRIKTLPHHQEAIDLIKSMSMEISHQSMQMSFKAAFLIEPNLSRLSNIDRITIPNIYIEVIEILKYHDQNIQIDVIYEGHLKLGKFKTSNKDTPIIGIYPKDNDISTIVGIEGMYRTDCYIENNVSTYVKGTYAKRKSTKLSSSIELLIHLRYVAKQEQQYYEARYALQNTKERIKYKDIPIGERIPNRYTNVF